MLHVVDPSETKRHWGSYELVDHDHDVNAADPMLSNERTRAFGQLPTFDFQTLGGAIRTEGRLQVVDAAVRQPIIDVLGFTQWFEHTRLPTGAIVGGAQPTLAMQPSNWVKQFVGAGKAVLVNIPRARSSATGEFMITSDPRIVAVQTQPGADYAVLVAPAQLLAAAQRVGAPVPTPPQPRPQTRPMAIPTWAKPAPPRPIAPPPEPRSAPATWLIPAAVGLGVFALGVAVFRAASRTPVFGGGRR